MRNLESISNLLAKLSESMSGPFNSKSLFFRGKMLKCGSFLTPHKELCQPQTSLKVIYLLRFPISIAFATMCA